MISFQNARVEMKIVSFCSKLSSLGSFVKQGAWEVLRVLAFVCYVAIDLCLCMEKVGELLYNRFLSYRVMAQLLDFEEM